MVNTAKQYNEHSNLFNAIVNNNEQLQFILDNCNKYVAIVSKLIIILNVENKKLIAF